jgi:hypothetical protein
MPLDGQFRDHVLYIVISPNAVVEPAVGRREK